MMGTEYAGETVMEFSNKYNYFMPKLSLTYNWGARLRGKRHEFESEKMDSRTVMDL